MSLSTDLKAKALAALTRYGLSATLSNRAAGIDKATGRPTASAPALTPTKAIVGPLKVSVEGSRRVVTTSATMLDEPTIGGTLTYAGAQYLVRSYQTIKPTDTAIIFTAEVEAL